MTRLDAEGDDTPSPTRERGSGLLQHDPSRARRVSRAYALGWIFVGSVDGEIATFYHRVLREGQFDGNVVLVAGSPNRTDRGGGRPTAGSPRGADQPPIRIRSIWAHCRGKAMLSKRK